MPLVPLRMPLVLLVRLLPVPWAPLLVPLRAPLMPLRTPLVPLALLLALPVPPLRMPPRKCNLRLLAKKTLQIRLGRGGNLAPLSFACRAANLILVNRAINTLPRLADAPAPKGVRLSVAQQQ